jgi:putative membrane protein insertion efficiency factor
MTCLRKLIIKAIKLYYLVVNNSLGMNCKFYPTCSCYAIEALRSEKSIIEVFYKISVRILKCNPLSKGRVDFFN